LVYANFHTSVQNIYTEALRVKVLVHRLLGLDGCGAAQLDVGQSFAARKVFLGVENGMD
jgi:hypothetical protein